MQCERLPQKSMGELILPYRSPPETGTIKFWGVCTHCLDAKYYRFLDRVWLQEKIRSSGNTYKAGAVIKNLTFDSIVCQDRWFGRSMESCQTGSNSKFPLERKQ